jgi:hypothetical protein
MEEIKEKLLQKLKDAFVKKKELTDFFEKNSKDPDTIEKDLKLKLGAITLKSVFIEANILTICNILSEEFNIDLESTLTKDEYFTYYILKNHAAYDLQVEENKLNINPEFETLITNLKTQIKNGSK